MRVGWAEVGHTLIEYRVDRVDLSDKRPLDGSTPLQWLNPIGEGPLKPDWRPSYKNINNWTVNMKQHSTWMILACVLPLLLIFLLPAFGVGSGAYLFIFLIFCFALHVLMMSGHRGGHNTKSEGKDHDNDTH